MDTVRFIQQAKQIVEAAGIKDRELNVTNFLDYSDQVRDIILDWPKAKQQQQWVKEFVVNLRRMRDDFQKIVEADPMVIYKPAHHVALEFHQSPSRIRYFRGGNRISKTESGKADNYWVMTGQHPYRPRAPIPAAVFIIGTNFSKYGPNVFEKKYLHGEPGNILSPMFPEDGKWFNHYDQKKHLLTIACPECAEKGKARQCKHPRSTLVLFSDQEGPSVLRGGQYAQGQFDEQVQYEFFAESLKRINTVPNSGLIVTETPENGAAWWTHKVLTVKAQSKEPIPGTKIPLVSLHTIDQFSAGLVDHAIIRADMMVMTEPEIRCKVFGEAVAANENAVFDLVELLAMRKTLEEPERGYLRVLGDKTTREILQDEGENAQVYVAPDEQGPLRVWRQPEQYAQYVIGVDVAQGLTKRDFSCASVLKMTPAPQGFAFEMVAQYHEWINPVPYAEQLYMLSIMYNNAYVVVERNGPGVTTLHQLVHELGCPSVYRDLRNPAQSGPGQETIYGVTTDRTNKSTMVSFLQSSIKNRHTGQRTIDIYDEATISELENYIQEVTESGLSLKFHGFGTIHDDRVMSLAVVIYTVKTNPFIYDEDRANQLQAKNKLDNLTPREREFWHQVHGYALERERDAYAESQYED